MSSLAKVLHFPRKAATPSLSPEEAVRAAEALLAVPMGNRSEDFLFQYLSSPDVLSSLARHLRSQRDSAPSLVLQEALLVYRWISGREQRLGLFDERDYFLGEFAFLAACAYRVLGKREEAFRWFDRAEAGFRHTVNPAAGLANIGYARLALRHEMGRYEDVLDLIPSLTASFEKLGMVVESAKCCLLKAMALKQCGRLDEALRTLEPLPALAQVQAQPSLQARVLSEIGDVRQQQGRPDLAIVLYEKALGLLAHERVSMARADLKMFLGGLLSGAADHHGALGWYRSALADCAELGMATRLAYGRVLVADELLALDRPREAEWEILQALPTIEEQRMVPEGFAAVGLLRESVRRKKADPNALRELRERLQKQS